VRTTSHAQVGGHACKNVAQYGAKRGFTIYFAAAKCPGEILYFKDNQCKTASGGKPVEQNSNSVATLVRAWHNMELRGV